MADKKTKKDSSKESSNKAERDIHVIQSVREANIPPKVRRIIVWTGSIFLIIGLIYSWSSVRDKNTASKKESGSKTEVWYLTFSEPPEQRVGVKVLDEGLGECRNLIDNSELFSMTCYGKQGYKTVDVFRWDKTTEQYGTWHRVGNKNFGGTFYLHKDQMGLYRGEAYARDKTTRFPILLHQCDKCTKT